MKMLIVVFSGTGNTDYVSKALTKELNKNGVLVEYIPLGLSKKEKASFEMLSENLDSYDMLGIGFPILGCNAPGIIYDFITTLPCKKHDAFLFATAADPHEINHLAFNELSKCLQQKDYRVIHNFLYLMPCNFMIAYPEPFNLQILDTIQSKVFLHTNELIQKSEKTLSITSGWKIIAKTIHYVENRWGRKFFGKSLYTNSHCTLCLHCLHHCPMGNIAQNSNTLNFGENCLFCMRCIYNCPQKAIQSKWYTWFILQEGYNLKNILNKKNSNRTFITNQSTGFWKHFYHYFDI